MPAPAPPSRASRGPVLPLALLLLAGIAAPTLHATVAGDRIRQAPLPSERVVLQTRPDSCGAAALATLLRARGAAPAEATEARILRAAPISSSAPVSSPASAPPPAPAATRGRPPGLSLREVAALAARFGAPGRWVRARVGTAAALPAPFLVHRAGASGAPGHYVTVLALRARRAPGAPRGTALIADPAAGLRLVPLADLATDGRVLLLLPAPAASPASPTPPGPSGRPAPGGEA